jgi:hypothetical protein
MLRTPTPEVSIVVVEKKYILAVPNLVDRAWAAWMQEWKLIV